MERGLEADASQELYSHGDEWPSPSIRTTVPTLAGQDVPRLVYVSLLVLGFM